MNFDQADFEVRCEWGEKGVLQLAPISDVTPIPHPQLSHARQKLMAVRQSQNH